MTTEHPQQLSLLPPATSPRPATDTRSVKLMVFNVQHASPARARKQVAWLADQSCADVVVLTEVGPGPGGEALLDALADYGYQSVVAPEVSRERDYRTVLASRGPALQHQPSPVAVLPHRAPTAHLRIGHATVVLVGLYVPSRGSRERRNEDKRAFQNAVTTALPCRPAETEHPVIIAGDLNVVEPDHVPHHRVFGTWEYDFYRSFATAHLTDTFRRHRPESDEHSWFGRGGNGYRFDHAFTTHPDHTRACGYLHEPRSLGLSDHSALYLHWEPPAEHRT